MGGSGSGRTAQRWRPSTRDHWRLDIRALATAARRQALEYGDPAELVRWAHGHADPPASPPSAPFALLEPAGMGTSPATLLVWARADRQAQIIELAYEPPTGGPEVRQELPFETERCHLGGERVWVRCECGRRAAIMYGPPFTCVHCSDLVYPSTRMTEANRMVNRALKLRRKLRDDWSAHDIEFAMVLGMPMPLPNKPRGAWFSRYYRIEEQIAEFEQRALSLNRSRLGRMLAALP